MLEALARARQQCAPLFARWCAREGAMFCPAAPATVASFVRDCAGLGIAQLWPALQDISRLHTSKGLADPTLSEPVVSAINELSGIAPPRSWPADRKARFKTLPYDLQAFIVGHEAARERALRRAQNQAAAARQKLAAIQHASISEESSGSHEDTSQQPIP
ncbi:MULTISPECIES: hypothetical protein [unclassified Bradyrhizobium]|uniref:hypothetical protein n=1 Tax=unclassified Bradyrhizobium TaxID=2631580 RepID=UPI0028EBB352|nr:MULTISPECIES: hypothetical protein [unclassified Bradyrhizobium]